VNPVTLAPARLLAIAVAALIVVGCGDDQEAPRPATNGDPGPVHVHGVGVDPADGALMIATHTGLFRAPGGSEHARRVGDRWQDTMGFTIVGPRRYLGSGHPDLRDDLPPFLGLIESHDGGRTWRAVSLQGKVDFHVLEASGTRIYGHGSDWSTRRAVFMVSHDEGRSWRTLSTPEPLQSLAIDPSDPDQVIASGKRKVYMSVNGGLEWSETSAPTTGLLAWTRAGIYLAAADGRVLVSARGARTWRVVSDVGEEPAAFDSALDNELLIAQHDGTIKRSDHGGTTWTIRSRP
jgi:hypothetical protein